MTELPGYLILCDAANVDPSTGKLNVLGEFDRIKTKKFPCVHRSCAIVAKIACEEGEHAAQFRFRNSSGEDVMPPSPPVKFKSPSLGSTRVIVEVKGLRFPKEGFYEVQMLVDDQFVKKADIFVSLVEQASPQSPPSSPYE